MDLILICDRILALLASMRCSERLHGLSSAVTTTGTPMLTIFLVGRPSITIPIDKYSTLDATQLLLLLTQFDLDSNDCSHLFLDDTDPGDPAGVPYGDRKDTSGS
jgi:hypothetical protein